MPTMEDIDPAILYCLFKGEPGTRKSTSALSFPRPQYWCSVDKKMGSLNLPMYHWKIDKKDIQFDDFFDWDKMRVRLEQIQTDGRLTDKRKIATLVLDSITSIGDVTNKQTRDLKSGQTKRSGQDAGRSVAGIAVNEVEDYNAESTVFQEITAITKDIHKTFKINVILIAHVIQTEQRALDGKTHMSRVLVTGGKKAAAKIPAYCDEIYHFNIKTGLDASKGGQYALFTTHTGDDYARTGLPLEQEIVFGNDPLYDKYLLPAIKKMKGEQSMLQA